MCLFGLPGLLIFLLIAGSSAPVAANVPGALDIPPAAAAAYAAASGRIGDLVTGCVVPAQVLMAIGKVESNHTAGHAVGDDGTVFPSIVGPALDGSIPGTAAVPDTDGGALDGDPVWDHAVGPMQILPATWRAEGRDANGDGTADPQDYADAALTAAVVLCRPAADLSDPSALASALHAYNPSDTYVAEVEAWVAAYVAAPGP